MLKVVAALTIAAFLSCTRVLPPPALPNKEVPFVAFKPGPQHPRMGRVAFDVSPPPASVEVVTSEESLTLKYNTETLIRTTGFICDAPCVVDMPYGSYKIKFTSLFDPGRTSVSRINVGYRNSIVQHNLGIDSKSMPFVWASYGLVLAGIALSAIGGAAGGMYGFDAKYTAMFGVGVSAIVGAGICGYFSETKQEGSTIQWVPEDGVIYQW